MGTLVAVEYVTLDGVFEEPAWSGPYFGEELQRFQYDNLFAADAMLLGRVTYEGFAAAWPDMEEMTGDFGVRMNTMPKHVATSTGEPLTWNATALEGDIVDAVAALKAGPENLLLNGSADLLNLLVKHGLVDELRLMVFPVVVGGGKKLWAEGGEPLALGLLSARTTATGVVIATYGPAGE